jgi:vacuolar protein sorting-associated protein 13A/C
MSNSSKQNFQGLHLIPRYSFILQIEIVEVLNCVQIQDELDRLELSLSHQDIRFYRSIARSQYRKDAHVAQPVNQQPNAEQNQGWLGWLWSGARFNSPNVVQLKQELTDEQRRELYEAVDYDEKSALAESFEASKDTQKLHICAQLKQASFRLLDHPVGQSKPYEILRIVANGFDTDILQRTDSFVVQLSLGSFSVFDGNDSNSNLRQVVWVKKPTTTGKLEGSDDRFNSFFRVKFEHNPSDERADNCLALRMEPLEIMYYRGYIEAIHRFFQSPASQLESVEALLVNIFFAGQRALFLTTTDRTLPLFPSKVCVRPLALP